MTCDKQMCLQSVTSVVRFRTVIVLKCRVLLLASTFPLEIIEYIVLNNFLLIHSIITMHSVVRWFYMSADIHVNGVTGKC